MKRINTIIKAGCFLMFILITISSKVFAQEVFRAKVPDNQKDGIVGLAFDVVYTKKYIKKEKRVKFNMAYTPIKVDTGKGYRYRGKIYGAEVPGLMEALNNVKVNTPTVAIEVSLNRVISVYKGTQILSFTAEGASNIFSDELHVDKVQNDNYFISITSLESVQYKGAYTWATFESLIEAYLDKQNKLERYKDLHNDGRNLMYSGNYKDAKKKFQQALLLYTSATENSTLKKEMEKDVESIRNAIEEIDEKLEKQKPTGHNIKCKSCKYYKGNGTTDSCVCTFCEEKDSKEKEAIKTEDKRREDVIIAKKKAEIAEKARIEKERLAKEEEKKRALERADFRFDQDLNEKTVTDGVANLSGKMISPKDDLKYLKSGQILAEGYDQPLTIDSNGNFNANVVLKSGANNIKVKIGNKTLNQKIILNREPVDLRVTLTWNSTGDVDLYLVDPDNKTCSYSSKIVENMILDVDNRSGYGPENIYVKRAKKGSYGVKIQNFNNATGAEATVYIFINEKLKEVKKVRFSSNKEFISIGNYSF